MEFGIFNQVDDRKVVPQLLFKNETFYRQATDKKRSSLEQLEGMRSKQNKSQGNWKEIRTSAHQSPKFGSGDPDDVTIDPSEQPNSKVLMKAELAKKQIKDGLAMVPRLNLEN